MTGTLTAAVYIDGANLYHTQKAMGLDVDFRKLRTHLASLYRITRMNYYTAIDSSGAYVSITPLIDWLDYNGYNVVTKEIATYTQANGEIKRKGNLDVDMAIDALDHAVNARPDLVMLITGDGDFVPLVRALQRRGAIVQAVSSLRPNMIADELRRAVDDYIDLEEWRDIIARQRAQAVA
jgi:uncharacterized LabA/DUF88 family protein